VVVVGLTGWGGFVGAGGGARLLARPGSLSLSISLSSSKKMNHFFLLAATAAAACCCVSAALATIVCSPKNIAQNSA
jgi:hypothetical protein